MPKQSNAHRLAEFLTKKNAGIFVICGDRGTGKTTLVHSATKIAGMKCPESVFENRHLSNIDSMIACAMEKNPPFLFADDVDMSQLMYLDALADQPHWVFKQLRSAASKQYRAVKIIATTRMRSKSFVSLFDNLIRLRVPIIPPTSAAPVHSV